MGNNLNNETIAYLIALGKWHKEAASNFVFSETDTDINKYFYHWSMYHLTDTLVRKQYMKKLTNNYQF